MIARKAKIGLLVVGGALIFGFQNCGGGSVKFASASSSGNSLGVSAPAPIPLSCPLGFTSQGDKCMPCLVYVELTPNANTASLGSFTIPAPDSKQTCYYLHVINSVDLGHSVASSNWKTYRNDIEARSHDVSHGNAAPRIIGSSANANGTDNVGAVGTATFTLQGGRTVSLSGSATGNVNMEVDNFILLEMNSQKLGQQILGEGTIDAVPWTNPAVASNLSVGPITVNGDPIQYVPFASGGTTDVSPVDLSTYFPIDEPVTVTTTGLDCGGVGDISDIYILFQ